MKKNSFLRRAALCLLSGVLGLSLVLPAMAANDTAASIKLSKRTGTVTVTNSAGRSMSVREGMALFSGYKVSTGSGSYAWLSLDNSKTNKVDASSTVELRKSGKKLELLLTAGNIFFDVSKPLEKDETLNIRTSTMVMGVRGTCGWVEVIDQQTARVGILEGTVTCTVTDPVSGQTKTSRITAGQQVQAVVYSQSATGEKCDILIEEIKEEDVRGFVLTEVAADDELAEKIYEASGLDLRELTDDDAAARQAMDQADAAARQKEIDDRASGQENNISKDPVWEREKETTTPGDSGYSGGSFGGSSGGSSPSPSPSPDPTATTITLAAVNADVTAVYGAFRGYDKVTVTNDGTPGVLTPTADFEIPKGKTLVLSDGISLDTDGTEVDVAGVMNVTGDVSNSNDVSGGALGIIYIEGTMKVDGDMTNEGDVTVTSSNSLHVTGSLTNRRNLAALEKGKIDVKGGITNSDTGGILVENSACKLLGTVTNNGWVLNNGALEVNSDFATDEGAEWYEYKEDVKTAKIGSGVVDIHSYTFTDCTNLTAFTAPASPIYSTPGGVLYTADGLALIHCPAKISGISYTVPATVQSIKSGAFADCKDLSTVTIEGAADIDNYAFDDGTTVYYETTVAAIPEWLSSCGGRVYFLENTDGTNKTYWNITGSVLNISGSGPMKEYSASPLVPPPWGSAPARVVIGKDVTAVSDYAFMGCSYLAGIEVAAGSANYAAEDGVLFELTGSGPTRLVKYPAAKTDAVYILPGSVAAIAPDALAGCSYLTDVYCLADAVIGDGGAGSNTTLHGPTVNSGTCGGAGNEGNVKWMLYGDNTLIISGRGAMADFETSGGNTVPWAAHKSDATAVIIDKGVTNIGACSFTDCANLAAVTLPISLETIGANAFEGCTALAAVTYAGSEADWEAVEIGSPNTPLDSITIVCLGQ